MDTLEVIAFYTRAQPGAVPRHLSYLNICHETLCTSSQTGVIAKYTKHLLKPIPQHHLSYLNICHETLCTVDYTSTQTGVIPQHHLSYLNICHETLCKVDYIS